MKHKYSLWITSSLVCLFLSFLLIVISATSVINDVLTIEKPKITLSNQDITKLFNDELIASAIGLEKNKSKSKEDILSKSSLQQILSTEKQPELNAEFAASYTRDNALIKKETIEKKIGELRWATKDIKNSSVEIRLSLIEETSRNIDKKIENYLSILEWCLGALFTMLFANVSGLIAISVKMSDIRNAPPR
ncbi:MAG TPA: hypothetical protein VM661_09865 [Candidatus Sulfotelmatobacter sp.]|jgi:hypothetical protein|nr:hypothetical protein [Candidatus Sulfotelmatobacter sp.]